MPVDTRTRLLHTAELCETPHIRVRDNLCMFETGPEGGHVDALERGLECIDDEGVCSVTDGMDILKTTLEYRREEGTYFLPFASRP